MTSVSKSNDAKWMPDESSTVCLRCGAEFGRILGASRHHCRTCGDLICQTCMVESSKVSHVVKGGVEYVDHLAPESKFAILKRPEATSLLGSAYQSLSSTAHKVKFCQPCMEKISREHAAFRQATYLLHAIAMFGVERQIRMLGIAIRAHLANHEYVTALSVIGKRTFDVLTNGFYMPTIRPDLQKDDEVLNTIIASFYRNFFAKNLTANIDSYVKTDSQLVQTTDQAYSHHTFIKTLLNSSEISDIRSETLRYVLSDVYRCLHMLLSRPVLGYKVQLFPLFLIRVWNGLLTATSPDFLLEFPCLLHHLICNNHTEESPYKSYLSQIRSMPARNRYFKNLICQATTPTILNGVCDVLRMNYEQTFSFIDNIYGKLLSVVTGTERFENKIQIPWTSSIINPLAKFNNAHAMVNIGKLLFAREPKTLLVDHLVSEKTNHVARVYQSWYVFSEPNFVMASIMNHIFELTKIEHPIKKNDCVLFDKRCNIFPLTGEEPALFSKPVLVLVPASVSQTRIVHVDESIAQDVEVSLNVYVTILLMTHLQEFIPIQTQDSMNLVEIAATTRNTQVINACLTYTGLLAVRKHILHGALHAQTVLGITNMLQRIVHEHLDKLYIALASLIEIGVDHACLVAFMNDIRLRTKNSTLLEVILKKLI